MLDKQYNHNTNLAIIIFPCILSCFGVDIYCCLCKRHMQTVNVLSPIVDLAWRVCVLGGVGGKVEVGKS